VMCCTDTTKKESVVITMRRNVARVGQVAWDVTTRLVHAYATRTSIMVLSANVSTGMHLHLSIPLTVMDSSTCLEQLTTSAVAMAQSIRSQVFAPAILTSGAQLLMPSSVMGHASKGSALVEVTPTPWASNSTGETPMHATVMGPVSQSRGLANAKNPTSVICARKPSAQETVEQERMALVMSRLDCVHVNKHPSSSVVPLACTGIALGIVGGLKEENVIATMVTAYAAWGTQEQCASDLLVAQSLLSIQRKPIGTQSGTSLAGSYALKASSFMRCSEESVRPCHASTQEVVQQDVKAVAMCISNAIATMILECTALLTRRGGRNVIPTISSLGCIGPVSPCTACK